MRMWLKGSLQPISNSTVHFQVNLYRLFCTRELLCKKNKSDFKLVYTPTMTLMINTPGVVISWDTKEIMDDIASTTFDSMTIFLQDRYSYIFKDVTDISLATMAISTWSRKIFYNEVMWYIWYCIRQGLSSSYSKTIKITRTRNGSLVKELSRRHVK